jgi:RND superfamily putative drug exporter
VFPIQVLTHGGREAAQQASAIAHAKPGVYTVPAPVTPSFRQGHDALVSVIPTAEDNTSAGTATVTGLRTALAHLPGGVEVGGNIAQNVDFNRAVYGNFPLMLAAIAIVPFLLLASSLRSGR